jgi:Lysine methyltransferase
LRHAETVVPPLLEYTSQHVLAADVMYIDDAVKPLVKTLAAVSNDSTRIYIAHGRNRQAEVSFLAAAKGQFDISDVPRQQLDEVYQCTDVAVWCLRRRKPMSQS